MFILFSWFQLVRWEVELQLILFVLADLSWNGMLGEKDKLPCIHRILRQFPIFTVHPYRS